ncbi:MAG TPA: Hsp20/alpha crystallin family protein [Actinomycetota bacterium]|nr:Hsp20/alpha crystallin family protein [Actinomycetota bacterium]
MSHVFASPHDAENAVGDEPEPSVGPWSPRIDVINHEGITEVRADLPGINPARDLKVIARDGHLTLRGERRAEATIPTDTIVHAERRHGMFERTILLPEGADPTRVRAEYRDGVLRVTIPTDGVAL